jgi:hypothetical protein
VARASWRAEGLQNALWALGGVPEQHRSDSLSAALRQSGKIADHTFEIEFLDPGVQAYAFTFG